MTVDFQGAHLTHANLDQTNCRGADFLRAYLEYATFEGADLTHARFVAADVKKADFRGSKGLSEETKEYLSKKGALVD